MFDARFIDTLLVAARDVQVRVDMPPGPPSPAVTRALRELLARELEVEEVRAAIDRVLVLHAHDDAARRRLFALVGRRSAAPYHEMSYARASALEGLRREAAADPARRAALLGLLRRVIAEMPAGVDPWRSGLGAVVKVVDELGGPAEVPVLLGLLATSEASLAPHIVAAVAGHDVAQAVHAAHGQIDRMADGRVAGDVGRYEALLLRADAREVAPALQRVLAREELDGSERRRLRALIGYLTAGSEAARVRQIYAYVAAGGGLLPAVEAALRTRHALDEAALRRAHTAYWARR